MKIKLFILIFSFSICKIFATAQTPDKIIIDEKQFDLLNNPLEQFFKIHPELDPIYGGKIKMFNKYRNKPIPIQFSTGNYRGYIATFKIENNFLKLFDIKIQNIESEKREYISVYKELFGDKQISLNYNGILIIPTGDFLDSANFGYSYLFSKYQLMTIKNDNIERSKEVTKDEYLKFKVIQFVEYKKTADYQNEVKEYFENWKTEKEIELSRKNTKNLTKREIAELHKEYINAPKSEFIDNFLFVTKNLDFVIVDY
jgi:hypothetical protein